MSAPSPDREQYARFYEGVVEQAQTGNRQSAESLISAFAQLADNPRAFDAVGGIPTALIQHIAACLSDWKKRDFQDAQTWFYVARAGHRPDETTGQHVAAIRAYLLLMARGKGVVAARAEAAAYSGLSEDQVRHLLNKDKPETAKWFKGRSIGVVTAAALLGINKRLHARVLNPPRKPRTKVQRSR